MHVLFRLTILLAALLVSAPSPAPAAPQHRIKFASLAPEGTTWMRIMRAIAKDVEKETKGALRFRIYPGGVSGNERDVVRKLRVGQLHAAGFTGVGLGEILPAVRLFELPFLFRDYEEVDAVHQALDPWYEKTFLKKGYVLLGWAEVGFAHFFSQTPIRSRRDLLAQKVWMWEGDPLARAYFQEMGIRPIPLAVTDVLTSLQTGLIETVYVNPIAAVALQWFTKVRYMNPLPMANVTGALIMKKNRFDQLGTAQQTILLRQTRKRMHILKKLTRDENERAIIAMEKRGLKISEKFSPMALAEIRERAGLAQKKLAGTLIPADLLKRALDILAERRGRK